MISHEQFGDGFEVPDTVEELTGKIDQAKRHRAASLMRRTPGMTPEEAMEAAEQKARVRGQKWYDRRFREMGP